VIDGEAGTRCLACATLEFGRGSIGNAAVKGKGERRTTMARRTGIRGWWLVLVGLAVVALSSGASAQALSGVVSSDLAHVAVYVDITYCASGGVQCTSTGHTAAAAAAGNHNPVRVVVQVSANNGSNLFVPVNDLSSDLFGVSTQLVPAGGATVERLACATCFQAVAGGTYAIFVHPTGSNLWKSGSYFAQIGFTSGSTTFFPAIARIDIP
jgi:hypothetical protein